MKKEEIPIDLKTAICNNQLIVFVGAGLSYDFKNKKNQPIKGWSNLVEQMLIHLKGKGYDVKYLIPLTKRCDPIKVLDLIESDKDIPKKEVKAFLKTFLSLNDDSNVELHKKIYKLSNKIITTNYDAAFEIAIPELRENKAYKGKNYELTTHRDKDAILLFKLHGCYEDADSMVLFPTDYNKLYNNADRDAQHSLEVLKNIVYNKTILFIGTGMGDFQINNIFKDIKVLQGYYNQKHYIISTKPLDSALDFLTHIKVKQYSDIESIIDTLNTIKEDNTNKDTEEVIQLKKQLVDAKEEIEKLGKEKNPNDKILLKREALKYYSRGLIYYLDHEYLKSIEEYKMAIELNPNDEIVYNNWGIDLVDLARIYKGKDFDDLYKQAFDKYKKAIKINPNYHLAYYNWGTSLGKLAATKVGLQSTKLYNQAIEKFIKVIEINPNYHLAFFNWGVNLGKLAKPKKGSESEELYRQAIEKFKKVIELKSNHDEAYYNWGTCLALVAEMKKEKEFQELLYLANNKFRETIHIKPDFYDAYQNWGVSLTKLALTKKGNESDMLFYEAFDKYIKAINIQPDYHESYNNWGEALSQLAKTKKGKEAQKLYNQAFEKYKKAVDLGGSSYNLSCMYALMGDKENALKYLEVSLSKGEETTTTFVQEDEDWKAYLKDKDFKQLMDKYS